MTFNHIRNGDTVHMVDVSEKDIMKRSALARAVITFSGDTLKLIKSEAIKKGPVLQTAHLAAVQAAKKTSELIPLCHNIPIDHVDVLFEAQGDTTLFITTLVKGLSRTGYEMEALTAATVAALTIYDMCKSHDDKMVIEDVRLETKVKEAI